MSARRWRILAALALVAAAVVLWLLAQRDSTDWLQRERLEAWLAALGPWGPLGLVVVEVLQVLLAPVPGNVVGLAAGYLYGAWAGAALCMVGLLLGTWLAVWLARRLGRPLVERLASPERLARLDAYARRRGALAFLLIYLVPFLPDDLLCFVAGLTPLRIRQVLLVAAIGRTPGVLVSTLIGAQSRALTWGQLTAIALASLALAALFWLYHERVERAAFALVDRVLESRRRRP